MAKNQQVSEKLLQLLFLSSQLKPGEFTLLSLNENFEITAKAVDIKEMNTSKIDYDALIAKVNDCERKVTIKEEMLDKIMESQNAKNVSGGRNVLKK